MRDAASLPMARLRVMDGRLLARAGWAVAVVIAATFVGVGTTILRAQIESGCPVSMAKECTYLRIDAAMAESLRAIGLSRETFATTVAILDALPPLAAALVSGLLVWRRGDDRIAVLAALTLVLFEGTVLQSGVTALASQPNWRWPVAIVQAVGSVLLMWFLNVFPDGRFEPLWTRWLVGAWIVWCAIGYFSPQDSPLSQTPPDSLFPLGVVGFLLVTLGGQIVRYFRHSNQVHRQQTKWALLGFAVALTVILANILVLPQFSPAPPDPAAAVYLLVGGSSFMLALLLMPVSVAIAVFRYRLFDVDLLISRALVYAGLSAGIVAVYVFVVGYLGVLFQTASSLPISLAAATVVAVAFHPVRERLQRAVNRLVYGERDEPYALLSRLGERLEGSLAPETVLQTVVHTVAEALRLPYAAIMLAHAEQPTASYGQPTDRVERFALAYGSEQLGEPRVAPRTGSSGFGAADRRLLGDIARQAGAAAHALRLSADLQRSRERLVAAREEERRRLRRDLHDGLGPALAAQ